MTNYTVSAFDDNGESVMVAHTINLSDAISIAGLFKNASIIDFKTMEEIIIKLGEIIEI